MSYHDHPIPLSVWYNAQRKWWRTWAGNRRAPYLWKQHMRIVFRERLMVDDETWLVRAKQ